MKPNLASSELAALYRKLCYARWLYEKGEQEAVKLDEMSHMLAILHFHNAVEMVVQNIIISYRYASSRALKNIKFDALIDLVDNKGTGGPQPPYLPNRTQIIKLSEQRNSIMHHGQQFHKNEVEEGRLICRQFLRDAVQDFFEIPIEGLSMSDLLKADTPRAWLQKAELCRENGEFEGAVTLCAAVVVLAERTVNWAYSDRQSRRPFSSLSRLRLRSRPLSHLGHSQLRLPHRYNELERPIDDYISRKFSHTQKAVEDLYKKTEECFSDVEKLLDSEIEDSTSNSWLIIAGVDLEQARLFFELGITVRLHSGWYYDISAWKKSGVVLTEESAEIAIRFATETALKVQALGLSDLMCFKEPPAKPTPFVGHAVALDLPEPLKTMQASFSRNRGQPHSTIDGS